MKSIIYTLAKTAHPVLGGKTFTGGVPVLMRNDRLVKFAEKIDGKEVYIRIADKPDLALLVAEYDQAVADEKAKAKADLEAAVPGLTELREAQRASICDAERFHRQFEAMMEDEQNDGVYPPKPENKTLAEKANALAVQYPRAALYLKAERQYENTSWADNTGKGAAGKKAMEILANNGSIEESLSALNERRDFID
jgi:hypothetical protein